MRHGKLIRKQPEIELRFFCSLVIIFVQRTQRQKFTINGAPSAASLVKPVHIAERFRGPFTDSPLRFISSFHKQRLAP
jgi:hypothetical protein